MQCSDDFFLQTASLCWGDAVAGGRRQSGDQPPQEEQVGCCSLSESLHTVLCREIQVYFTHTKRLLPNNPAGNTWLQVAGERRVHQVHCVIVS